MVYSPGHRNHLDEAFMRLPLIANCIVNDSDLSQHFDLARLGGAFAGVFAEDLFAEA